ncbi:MAG: PKD domain-containing protein [bacterium]|nr:PKD domain-containing protein [bacterium]
MKTIKAAWVLGAALSIVLVACSEDDPAGPDDTTPPMAAFQADTPTGQVPLAVTFTDDSTGEPTAWAWDFGDGGTSTAQNPSHTYTVAGDFTVALTATNAGGSDTETDVDCVSVSGTAGGDPPVADFSASTTSGLTPVTVQFTDASTDGPTVWNWNFGDGATSTDQNPSHTYSSAGSYTVALSVHNAYGTDTETRADYVTVTDPVTGAPGITADHLATADFADLPAAWADNVASDLRLFYGHTSHGSQLMTGLWMIEQMDASYDQPAVTEISDDLGHRGDLTWVAPTRAHLDAPGNDTNVVVWSWCGGASDNTVAGVDAYLAAMTQLEADYPDVVFIYMTGHLDGTGVDGSLYTTNNQIRAYCEANNKWLFDFADIESYDPDGTYYPDALDRCDWCVDWCATHDCEDCYGCAHSHCFNCFRKGQAFWWLLGRVAGWEG